MSSKALRGDTQLLLFLDILTYRKAEAVALLRLGLPAKAPTPEKFGADKLVVLRLRLRLTSGHLNARNFLLKRIFS